MDSDGFSFENEWPDTAARLETALRRRRIPAPLIDDLVQDTGLRLFQKWECVDPERGSWPLAYTVAMNILKDQLRSEERRQPAVPPPAPPDFDPEVMALARIELEKVRDALIQLSPAQRSALLAEIGEHSENGRSKAADKMLRLRARKRLKTLTQDAPGLLGSLEVLAQRFLERAHSLSLPSGTGLGAPLAAGLLSLGLISTQSSVGALGSGSFDTDQLPRSERLAGSVAEQISDALSSATHNPSAFNYDDPVVLLRLSGDGTYRATRSGARSGGGKAGSTSGGRKGDEKGGGSGDHGEDDGLGLPDDLDPLPSQENADSPPEPVTVENADSDVGPNGAGASASGSAAGHQGSVEAGVSPGEGSNGDSGGVPQPEVEGGAQVDGEELLTLG